MHTNTNTQIETQHAHLHANTNTQTVWLLNAKSAIRNLRDKAGLLILETLRVWRARKQYERESGLTQGEFPPESGAQDFESLGGTDNCHYSLPSGRFGTQLAKQLHHTSSDEYDEKMGSVPPGGGRGRAKR
jgi:hypothetical protein